VVAHRGGTTSGGSWWLVAANDILKALSWCVNLWIYMVVAMISSVGGGRFSKGVWVYFMLLSILFIL